MFNIQYILDLSEEADFKIGVQNFTFSIGNTNSWIQTCLFYLVFNSCQYPSACTFWQTRLSAMPLQNALCRRVIVDYIQFSKRKLMSMTYQDWNIMSCWSWFMFAREILLKHYDSDSTFNPSPIVSTYPFCWRAQENLTLFSRVYSFMSAKHQENDTPVKASHLLLVDCGVSSSGSRTLSVGGAPQAREICVVPQEQCGVVTLCDLPGPQSRSTTV